MRVQFTRPHVGGSMTGLGNDVKVIDLADAQEGQPAAEVPAGGTMVDSNTPVQDWTWDRQPSGGINGGGK